MEQIPAPPARIKRPTYLWWALFACVALLVLYTYIYYFEPFSMISPYTNHTILNILIFIPALAAALLCTKLTKNFKPAEPPHRIWLTFTIGWWFWVSGELLGFVYNAIYRDTDYPAFTFIDLCWTLGYLAFGFALYYQYRLIYFGKQRRKSVLYLLFVILALTLTLALTHWSLAAGLGAGTSFFAVYLAILYPVFDTFEGGAALRLFFLFGRGYLGRPWWGLIAFAIADSINTFFWLGGADTWVSANAYILLDVFSAMAYISGYLISALAFLAALDHIHRGAPSESTSSPVGIGD